MCVWQEKSTIIQVELVVFQGALGYRPLLPQHHGCLEGAMGESGRTYIDMVAVPANFDGFHRNQQGTSDSINERCWLNHPQDQEDAGTLGQKRSDGSLVRGVGDGSSGVR